MKTTLASLALMLASSATLLATPERSIHIEEDFLGCNETGFVVLRTETDNHGSYYSLKTTRYLDEYEKVPEEQPVKSSLAHRTKRTTLLDVSLFNDPPNKERTVNAQDASIKIADLLVKYPQRAKKWEASNFAKFSTWKQDGEIRTGWNEVIRRWDVEHEIFGIKAAELKWELEEARQDMNCLYLRVTTGMTEEEEGDDEGSRQSRWICILPDKTRQIHDHLKLQPFYLSAGNYTKADEAVKQTREIIEKAKGTPFSGRSLEVWSVDPPNVASFFTIVLPDSMTDIDPEKFKQAKLLLGPDISPISSHHFVKKTPFSESP